MSASVEPPKRQRMTADEFLRWTLEQDEAFRGELYDGLVVAMAPETLGHMRAKLQATRCLAAAIAAAGLDCEAMIDGVGVRLDADTVVIPDAMVRCGPPAEPDAREIGDPIIVVEVTSPSTQRYDRAEKVFGYFSLPSVMHYLILMPGKRRLIHHARSPDGRIETRLRGDGPLQLDPPGLLLQHIFGLGA